MDARAMMRPEKLAELLVRAHQPPTHLSLETEDLESYFLRTICETEGMQHDDPFVHNEGLKVWRSAVFKVVLAVFTALPLDQHADRCAAAIAGFAGTVAWWRYAEHR